MNGVKKRRTFLPKSFLATGAAGPRRPAPTETPRTTQVLTMAPSQNFLRCFTSESLFYICISNKAPLAGLLAPEISFLDAQYLVVPQKIRFAARQSKCPHFSLHFAPSIAFVINNYFHYSAAPRSFRFPQDVCCTTVLNSEESFSSASCHPRRWQYEGPIHERF